MSAAEWSGGDKDHLVAGLRQVEAAGKNAAAALRELQDVTDDITRMYRDEPGED